MVHAALRAEPILAGMTRAPMQREVFICTGDLVPRDNELTLAEVQLEVEEWDSTTEIMHSIVRVKLDAPSAHEGVDSRAQRTQVLRAAQYFADMWLSVVSFAEGACYSTQIFKIEDSAGCIREFGPRLKFGPGAGDLRFRDAENVAGLVAEMSLRNTHFEMAVGNYTTALRWSQDAPFHCYRALEILCEHFGGNWEKMHESLGTNQCAIYTLIKQHADLVRHGRSPDFQEMDLSTWYALTYIRDTLLAFLIKNSTTKTNLELPVLDHSRIPDHITTVHKGNCLLRIP